MNAPALPIADAIDAHRAVLWLCAVVPRPIPYPQTSSTTTIRG